MLKTEKVPEQLLTEEDVDQTEGESRVAVGWSEAPELRGERLLTEGNLVTEEEEGCSEWNQQRSCLAGGQGRQQQLPEVPGSVAGLVCPPTQQRAQQVLAGHRRAGRMSPSRSRCPVEGWECWERSCGCPDQYLWCHCCRHPERCGFLTSSPPPPQPPPLSGSPVDPEHRPETKLVFKTLFVCRF